LLNIDAERESPLILWLYRALGWFGERSRMVSLSFAVVIVMKKP
jgi:hypothetical protein